MNEDKLLTFETSKEDKRILEIHTDMNGLHDLKKYIDELISTADNTSDHVHLMVPSWTGDELNETAQSDANDLIKKVTIFLWQ